MDQVSNSNSPVDFSRTDREVDHLIQQSQPQLPKQPGTFRRILGAAVGLAGNVFAPGLGGALGNLIGGGVSGGTAGTDPNQYLQLAKQVNAQSEAFQAVSDVLKSKHDSAMAAINTIKD